jgi:Ankyrin repeats (3 copies)
VRLPAACLVAALFWAAQGAHAQPAPEACNVFSESGVEQAFRGNPAHAASCHAFAMALIRRSSRHDHRLGAAELIVRTLQRFLPQGPYAYIGLAELQMRRLELGIESDVSLGQIHDSAERATHIKPVLPEAYVTLGRADLLAGCTPCASRAAEIARSLGVASPELSELRARVAESGGDGARARSILEQAVAATALAPEDRSRLQAALAELLVRGGDLEAADRALAQAAASDAENLPAYIRRAEIRLFDRGDVQGALDVASGNRRAASSLEFKRVRAMAQYLEWSRKSPAARTDDELRRIVQRSYLGPEDALVACARHRALTREFETLLGAGLVRDVDARDGAGDTALLAAAAGGNRDAVRLLVARSANVDAADRRGRRPLSFAVERSDHEATALLLGAGAAVDYADLDERSPLLLAVQKGDAEGTAMLLRRRAETKAGPPDGAGDLLVAAAARGDESVLHALLDSGIPADSPDRQGRTALIAAAYWGNAGAARVLLDAGADASRALDAAQASGDGAMLELLKAYLKRSI